MSALYGGEHGYNAYTYGCRCDTCRAAKAEYMSRRRGNAFLNKDREPVQGIAHGRCGYEEHGCRCDTCVEARRAMWREDSRRRRGAVPA